MFVYCLWCGDVHENTRLLLTHQIGFADEEFIEFCNKIRNKLINNTTQNHEIMDTVDGKKSIWEYCIDFDMLKEIKDGLIKEYGFQELNEFPSYHVKGVDPYDYD